MNIAIYTSRLVLCPHGMKYLESTHEYACDPENTRFMLHLPAESIESTAEFLSDVDAEWAKESPQFYEFAVLLDGVHIGACSFRIEEDGSAELGWLINKRYWRRGYCAEAAAAVVRFAIDELDVKRFIAHCDSENAGSYGVMEKLGMKRVSLTGGRHNKSSDEERMELMYAMNASECSASADCCRIIREMKTTEYPELENFLYEAIFVPEGVQKPPRDIVKRPELQVYTAGFGSSPHDCAIVARIGGKSVGAAWGRIMNDYGHVDDQTPSLAIALYEEYRGKGTGTALMKKLTGIYAQKGYEQISLAVQKNNYAVRLYKSVGFEIAGENEEEYIMVCRLKGRREVQR